MKVLTATILVAGLLLAPFAANVSSASSGDATPPIAQPLVREGDFAVRLSQGLMGGSPNNESEAENSLASIGIAPRNGWIADYPVTPDILGELKERIRAAAESGALAKSRDEALSAMNNVETEFGLHVYAGPDANSSYSGQGPGSYPDTAAFEGYYDENGPPVVSYYPPPDYYTYLYDWVPYPFWWSDVWFPGFFVLADFDILVFNHHRFHHHFRDRHHFMRVTNHVGNTTTGSMARVDPVTGKLNGSGIGTVNMTGARTLTGTAQTNAGRILDRSVARNSTAGSQMAMSRAVMKPRDMDRAPLGRQSNFSGFQRMSPNVSSAHEGRSFADDRGSGGVAMRSFSRDFDHSRPGFSGGHSVGGFGGFSGGHSGGGHGRR